MTGGNRGIGAAVVARFAAAGDRVAATTRTPGLPGGVLELVGDLTDPGVAADLLARVEAEQGVPDVLVSNAGITRDKLFLRMTEADLRDVLEINLIAAWRLITLAARSMVRRGSGRIVVISSVAATRGNVGQVNYAASKAGLIGMSRSLAREVAPRGVTVNVVAPGLIDTDMTAALSDAARSKHLGTIPAARSGTPEEVAAAVEWLASPGAAYVTGAVLPVDGGLGMGH